MRIQTSDVANIGTKGSTSRAEKKKCWSTFAKKLQIKRVKWKFLVDFHEDSNLRSTGLLLYTLPAEVYKTRSAIVNFICISFSTWVYDQQVVQIQFCSLLEGNTWSIQVGFQASDLVDQTTRLYTWWELLTWSGKDYIKDINNSWSMVELSQKH